MNTKLRPACCLLQILVLPIAMIEMASVQNTRGQSCGVGGNFENKAVTASKSKCGFPEFDCQVSSPPKYYLKQVSQGNASWDVSSSSGSSSSSDYSSEIVTYDHMSRLESSYFAESGVNSEYGAYSCTTTTTTNNDTTSTGDCSYLDGFWGTYAGLKFNCIRWGSFSTNGDCSSTAKSYGEQGSATLPTFSCDVQSSGSSKLCSEYTDSMLRGDMISLLPAAYPTDWTVSGNSCGSASYNLTSDHFTASGGKFKYRVHIIPCVLNEKYLVEWDEVTAYANSGQPPSIKHMKEKVTGNGDPNGLYTSEREVGVPAAECTIDEENLQVTLDPSGSGGGGPGGGGQGGGGPGHGPGSQGEQ